MLVTVTEPARRLAHCSSCPSAAATTRCQLQRRLTCSNGSSTWLRPVWLGEGQSQCRLVLEFWHRSTTAVGISDTAEVQLGRQYLILEDNSSESWNDDLIWCPFQYPSRFAWTLQWQYLCRCSLPSRGYSRRGTHRVRSHQCHNHKQADCRRKLCLARCQ